MKDAYQDGFQAYQAGEKLDNNPYLEGKDRDQWRQGWLDAATTDSR
jgi:ribosome modulation factor